LQQSFCFQLIPKISFLDKQINTAIIGVFVEDRRKTFDMVNEVETFKRSLKNCSWDAPGNWFFPSLQDLGR